MTLASGLHAQMLQRYDPNAAFDVLFPADANTRIPSKDDLRAYTGIIWTGCDKTLADSHGPDLQKQLDLAQRILQAEAPCWGTCWGIQIMAVAAGGKVGRNPNGREIGLARKIKLTSEGRAHPMYAGKNEVFDALASHSDIVTIVPPHAVILASNDYSAVQAMSFSYGKGIFWGVQYHPDFDIYQVARLMIGRKEALISEGFFQDSRDFDSHIERMETLAREPKNKCLRWQLGVDEDILSADMRQREFANWLKLFATENTENTARRGRNQTDRIGRDESRPCGIS